MNLSEYERETLIGPALTGVVVGIFCAVCAVALNSEYEAAALSDWPTICNTILSFLAGILVAFVPFGLAPVLIGRLRSTPPSIAERRADRRR